MSEGNVITLDVQNIPPRERHPKIFDTFDSLQPGDKMILINDHDPKPLKYQLEAERTGQMEWEYILSGPEEWKVYEVLYAVHLIGARSFPPLHRSNHKNQKQTPT